MIRHTTKSAVFGLMAAIAWLPAAGADDPAAPADPPSAPATRPAGRERWGPNPRPRERDRDAPPAFIGPRDRVPRGDLPWDEGLRRDRLRPLRQEKLPPDPSRGTDLGPPVGPEQIEEFMAFTKEHFPEMYEPLARTRRVNTGRFHQMLRTMQPHILWMRQMSREDPQLAETVIGIQRIEMRLRMLRQQYRPGLSEEQRLEIRSNLRRLLEQRFDLRMQRIELEIANLRKRLDEQHQHKERVIEQELSQLFEPPPARARGALAPTPPGEPENSVTPAAANR